MTPQAQLLEEITNQESISLDQFKGYCARMFAIPSDPQDKIVTLYCGPRTFAFLTGQYDPATRRNRFAGSAHQRRKIRRYHDRQWKAIGSFKPTP